MTRTNDVLITITIGKKIKGQKISHSDFPSQKKSHSDFSKEVERQQKYRITLDFIGALNPFLPFLKFISPFELVFNVTI